MSNNTLIEQHEGEEIGYTKTFWIGLGVSVITNLIQAFALSFQRKSHLLNDALPIELRKSSFKRPMWTVAFLSFISANLIGSIFSIGYLPIVILAPIGAMNLVFNTIAAYIVLGDPLSRKNIIGNKSPEKNERGLIFTFCIFFRYWFNCIGCIARWLLWCDTRAQP
jgi:drug/metabolite transporter (DMT)-like permease